MSTVTPAENAARELGAGFQTSGLVSGCAQRILFVRRSILVKVPLDARRVPDR